MWRQPSNAEAVTAPETSCLEPWSLSLPAAPHAISRWARWPCWPASTQLEQNESRVGFGVSSEEGRWGSLFQSEQDHRDWKAQAMGLLPESTFFDLLWWVHRGEPGVLLAHARMYWLSDWPPASTPPTGLWLASYQTAVPGATGGRPRLCPGQQLHRPDSAWRDGPHAPLPSTPAPP